MVDDDVFPMPVVCAFCLSYCLPNMITRGRISPVIVTISLVSLCRQLSGLTLHATHVQGFIPTL